MKRKKFKLLICYDGSDCAEGAIKDLAQAGLPQSGEAVVMSIAEIWLPPPPASSYEILEPSMIAGAPAELRKAYAKGSRAARAARALAERGAGKVRKCLPKWKVRAEVSYGSPAWELVFKADQWKPDLIVVGSHGRTALGRMVMGSVSQRVLTEARCSVRIARGARKSTSPLRIIVGIDGSRHAKAAVAEVAARNWPKGTHVRVVAVDDPLKTGMVGGFVPPLVGSIGYSNQLGLKRISRLVEKTAEELRSKELSAESAVEVGNPKKVIPAMAQRWGANCIFMGARGFSNRVERFLLGSVSASVAARARCSVEVVRRKTSRR